MDRNFDKEEIEKYKGGLDTCECNHIRIQHVNEDHCVWCTCPKFKKRIDSNSKTQNK
jgi:hypothetical protein